MAAVLAGLQRRSREARLTRAGHPRRGGNEARACPCAAQSGTSTHRAGRRWLRGAAARHSGWVAKAHRVAKGRGSGCCAGFGWLACSGAVAVEGVFRAVRAQPPRSPAVNLGGHGARGVRPWQRRARTHGPQSAVSAPLRRVPPPRERVRASDGVGGRGPARQRSSAAASGTSRPAMPSSGAGVQMVVNQRRPRPGGARVVRQASCNRALPSSAHSQRTAGARARRVRPDGAGEVAEDGGAGRDADADAVVAPGKVAVAVAVVAVAVAFVRNGGAQAGQLNGPPFNPHTPIQRPRTPPARCHPL